MKSKWSSLCTIFLPSKSSNTSIVHGVILLAMILCVIHSHHSLNWIWICQLLHIYSHICTLAVSTSNNCYNILIINTVRSKLWNRWMVKILEWMTFPLKNTIISCIFIKNLKLMSNNEKNPLIIRWIICMQETRAHKYAHLLFMWTSPVYVHCMLSQRYSNWIWGRS